MKKKMRKFADGGFSTAEGENKNISDDIRARALRSVAPDDSPAGTTGYGEQNDLPETKTVTKTTVSKTPAKTPAKAPAMPAEEKERIANIGKKQELKNVSPEDYIPGVGMMKGLLKRGLKTITRDALPAPSAVKQLENKATKMLPYDKAGAMAKKRSERAEARTDAMRKENAGRYGVTDPSAPGFGALREKMMKKGGSVKSSASRRADGCAVRGKTRA